MHHDLSRSDGNLLFGIRPWRLVYASLGKTGLICGKFPAFKCVIRVGSKGQLVAVGCKSHSS